MSWRSNSRLIMSGSCRAVPPYSSGATAAYPWSRNRRGVSIFARTAGLPGIMTEPVAVETRISSAASARVLESELLGERTAPRQSQNVNLGLPLSLYHADLLQQFPQTAER